MGEKIKTSVPLNMVIAIGAVGALVGLAGIGREALALRQEYRATQAKIAALRSERARLSARLAELETPEAIEREAKEKLNLKNKGERVVVVVPEDTPSSPSPRTGWWPRVKNFFAGMF